MNGNLFYFYAHVIPIGVFNFHFRQAIGQNPFVSMSISSNEKVLGLRAGMFKSHCQCVEFLEESSNGQGRRASIRIEGNKADYVLILCRVWIEGILANCWHIPRPVFNVKQALRTGYPNERWCTAPFALEHFSLI